MNDYHTISLTPVISKGLERVVLTFLLDSVKEQLDPFQFAYRSKCGVDDATVYLLQRVTSLLDKPGTYVRILFVDYSSTFNTTSLYNKLQRMNVPPELNCWIFNFLVDRPQYFTEWGYIGCDNPVHGHCTRLCPLTGVIHSLYQ